MASLRTGLSFFLLLFVGIIHCQDDEDQSVWSESMQTNFGVAQPSLSDTLMDISFKDKILFSYKTPTNEKAFVLDDILNASSLSMLRGFMSVELGAWKFSLYEPYEGGEEKPNDGIPWVNELDSLQFANSALGRIVQKAVMDVSGSKDIYYPYRVRAKILRRGDFTRLYSDASVEDDEYSMMMFLNTEWQKNDYGEIYLYDKDQEIFGGAVPKYGRAVIWQSSVSYLARPPSMAFKKGLFLLHIQFSKSKDKVYKSSQNWERGRAERIAVVSGDFVGVNQPAPASIDLKNKLVREYQTKNGKKVFVFDDLFEKKDLDMLRVVILNYGLYYYDDSDDDGDSDNVQWIAGFAIDKYIRSRLWNITRRVASHVSGTDKWFPYDVSCNLIRNADHTRIHNDCGEHEEEWTFLIYLNPGMTKNDYGETVFYEEDTKNPEIAAEVRPKYGRAVIFQGIIPHSARPPSTNYTNARLTFVAKLSVNEFVGRTKAFLEEIRHYTGVRYQQMFVKSVQNGAAHAQTRQPAKAKKYQAKKDEEESENEEGEEKEGEESNGKEPEKPSAVTPSGEEDVDMPPEFNDPKIQSLEEKQRQLGEDPEKPLDKMRALHRELTAAHELEREMLRQNYAKVI